MTDQNSLSESEQYPAALGLVRLQEVKGKKSVVALQGKQMEHHAVLFLCFSCLQLLVGCVQDEPAWLREAGINLSEALTCYPGLTCKSNLLSVPSTVRVALEELR